MKTLRHVALTATIVGAFASQAHAAGFQLSEQSVVNLGRSYAGAGSDGTDISGVYYNPSTIVLGTGTRFQAGGVLASLNLDYRGLNGSRDNGRHKDTLIPHMYIAHQVTDRLQVGLGLTTAFGLATNYGQNWDLAGLGTSSDLRVLDLNPTVAFKVNDWLTIGGGFSIQRADATLKFNVMHQAAAARAEGMAIANNPNLPQHIREKGTAAANAASVIVNNPAVKANPELTVKVNSTHLGYNLGVLITPTEHLRIGLSYRSAIHHHANGTLTLPAMTVLNGYAKIQMDAPAWAQLSASWDINPTYTLSGQVRWTDWSSFKNLTIRSNSALMKSHGGEFTIHNNWRDSWFYSVGLDAHVTDKLTLRGGLGYESGVIADPKTRTGTIPDANRIWLSAGASYTPTKNWQIDVGASYLKGTGERGLYNPYTKAKMGDFKSLNAILLGAQVQYRF